MRRIQIACAVSLLWLNERDYDIITVYLRRSKKGKAYEESLSEDEIGAGENRIKTQADCGTFRGNRYRFGRNRSRKAIPTAEQIEILEGLYCCELTRNEEERLESMPPFQISGEDLSADELMALAKIGRIALNSRFMANILS